MVDLSNFNYFVSMEIKHHKHLVIGITGQMGAGKDTAARILKKAIGATYSKDSKLRGEYECLTIPMAQKLKEVVAVMGGLPDYKWFDSQEFKSTTSPFFIKGEKVTWRQMLQLVGTEGLRSIDPNIHCQMFHNLLNQKNQSIVLVPDIRFDNEAQYIKDNFNGVILKINRPETDKSQSEITHDSEKGISRDLVDMWFTNSRDINFFGEMISVYAEHLLFPIIDELFVNVPSPKLYKIQTSE